MIWVDVEPLLLTCTVSSADLRTYTPEVALEVLSHFLYGFGYDTCDASLWVADTNRIMFGVYTVSCESDTSWAMVLCDSLRAGNVVGPLSTV